LGAKQAESAADPESYPSVLQSPTQLLFQESPANKAQFVFQDHFDYPCVMQALKSLNDDRAREEK
jgi:hypothetical protein